MRLSHLAVLPLVALLPLVAFSACTPEESADDTGGGESDTDSVTDSDSPVDTDSPEESDTSVEPCVELTWYQDNDEDGYGAGSDTQLACEAPGPKWALVDGDCSDNDPEVNPSKTEVCDFKDTDCDATTSEVGMVTFTNEDGAVEDFTATFAAGTESAPVDHRSGGRNGTYRVCDGTFYVNILANANLEIIGAGTARTTLHGGATERVFRRGHQNQTHALRNLRIVGGALGGDLGGGVFITSRNTVTLADVIIEANSAGNGGGLAVIGSDVTVQDSDFINNTATASGAAIIVQGDSTYGNGNLTLNNVRFSNHTSGAGVIFVGPGGTLTAASVDFVDNTTDAVHSASGQPANFGSWADFSCTESGCN